MPRTVTLLSTCLALAACAEAEPVGLPVLGAGSHDAAMLQIEVIATADDGLSSPTDAAFNLRDPDSLWVTNYADNSITVLRGDDLDEAWTSGSPGQDHFLVAPMSLAFTDFGNFATIHDTDDLTQGTATPADFMGPVLWDDSDMFDGGHGGHLDMLHNSPLGGGIAWDEDNVFWVFDGYHSSLTRYDFREDHGYGGAYHGDAIVVRYAEGEVSRTEGIPSHLDMDRDSGLLYAADTNNNRIAVLNTSSGDPGDPIGPNYDGGTQYEMLDAEIDTLVDGDAIPVLLDDKGEPTILSTTLSQPAGLELHEGILWVTDHDTSQILAFDLDGVLIDWVELDRPSGSLAGLDVDAQGRLLVVDMDAEEVLRISPAPLDEE